MADIRHTVHIDASPERVFALASSQDGVARWWTPRVAGDHEPGGRLVLRFGDWNGETQVVVRERSRDKRVVWEVTANNEGDEWPGTRIELDLEPEGNGTRLRFGHTAWREATDYFAECNVFWGFFVRNLKHIAETGEPLRR